MAFWYEYFKGQQDNFYYCLLAFRDKWAFYAHQNSPYHEGHDFGAVLQSIVEYLDPVQGACPLPETLDPPIGNDTPADMVEASKKYPLSSQAGGVKGCNLPHTGDSRGISTGTLLLNGDHRSAQRVSESLCCALKNAMG